MITIVAKIGLITLFVINIIFHLGIILKWIPYTFVWGGKLKTDQQMYQFETVSLVLSVAFLWIAIERLRIYEGILPEKYQTICLWIMAVFFFINSIGNFLSTSNIEKIFLPIAILATIFCVILAISNT